VVNEGFNSGTFWPSLKTDWLTFALKPVSFVSTRKKDLFLDSQDAKVKFEQSVESLG